MLNKIRRFLTMTTVINKINDIKIVKGKECYEIYKENKLIKISSKHRIYILDIVDNFDFYFSAIKPDSENGKFTADYSKESPKQVVGYDLHKIIFPSIPEPIVTTKQYINFAKLDESSVVLDLGSYSGLTSILFDREISKNNNNASGKVISVEADVVNLSCLIQNIELYKSKTNRNIQFLFAVASNKNGYETFIADGCMGSNAGFTRIFRNALIAKVPSLTLSSIAERFALEKVDFIKCDIEGSEKYIFQDKKFFEKYSPRIIVESHSVNNIMTTNSVIKTLEQINYTCKIVKQEGSCLPLIECTRNT